MLPIPTAEEMEMERLTIEGQPRQNVRKAYLNQ
jgi:hypothetical protein